MLDEVEDFVRRQISSYGDACTVRYHFSTGVNLLEVSVKANLIPDEVSEHRVSPCLRAFFTG